jgi:hypothetical protein
MAKCPMYIVEARQSGALNDDKAAQPPFNVASERQLFDYHNEHSDRTAYQGEPGHWAMVKAFFSKRGWVLREKAW